MGIPPLVSLSLSPYSKFLPFVSHFASAMKMRHRGGVINEGGREKREGEAAGSDCEAGKLKRLLQHMNPLPHLGISLASDWEAGSS